MTRRLKTQDNIRQALAAVYRDLEEDEIAIDRARAMIYCLLSLSSLIAGHQPAEDKGLTRLQRPA